MSIINIGSQFGRGGTGLTDGTLKAAITELQGLTVTVVAGAASNTKMDVAALRTEDTLLAALVTDDGGGAVALSNDIANMVIQDTHASAAFTFTGAPSNAQTCTVNDVVYTAKTVPLSATDFKIGANVTATALALANSINAYETRGNRAPDVVAVPAVGVVTVTSVVDGAGNAPAVTGTVTTLAEDATDPAAVTLTPVSVVEDVAATINGVVFTAKDAPVGDTQFDVKLTDVAQGAELARAVNYYDDAYGTLDVLAVADAGTGVVTLTPRGQKAGNIITLADTNLGNCTATGAGFLANGTDTGGVKTATSLTAKTVTLLWFNKQ